MAVSPTPKPTASELNGNPCSAALSAWPGTIPEGLIGVAFSGGADSTALLLAAASRWPGRVHALHVHHGLQPAADSFVTHCQSVCDRLGVPLHVAHADGRAAPGQSPEDAARRVRYVELARLAQVNALACVMLAQHADDQAETLLLALSRGAGLPGMAAMPARFERHGCLFLRPLLGVPGPAIRAWLAQAGMACVQDPSNADEGLTRNRIRHRLLPALENAFPGFREMFARSAAHAAQAKHLLTEVAASDLTGQGAQPSIKALQALSPARQANALRHWLKSQHGVSPSAAQLAELQSQIAACTTRGHAIRIKVASGFVQRVGDSLAFTGPVQPGPAGPL